MRDQLNSYLNSGNITHLYIAVPSKLENRIKALINQQTLTNKADLTSIGIILVNENGTINKVKKAKRQPLKDPSYYKMEKKSHSEGRFRERIYVYS